MNNERVIFGIGGVVVGGIAGTLITTAYLKKAFEDKLNEAVADVKSVYMSRYEATVSAEEALDDKVTVEETIESVEEEASESEFDVDAYETVLRESRKTKVVDEVDPLSYIHVIDLDTFLEEPEPDWDKMSLMYFEEDDTLCDHNYMLISLVVARGIVGPEFREWFGQLSEDENTVFIRNENTRTDYEVMREEGTYLDAAGT